MPRRTARNNIKRIKIKTRRRSGLRHRSSFGSGLLDSHVSVRTLLIYGGIILAFLVVLLGVFLLGRFSASGQGDIEDGKSTISSEMKQETKQVDKTVVPEPIDDVDEPEVVDAQTEDESSEELMTDAPEPDEDPVEYVYTAQDYGYEEDELFDEQDSECTPKVADFDYNYTKVELSVSNYQRTMKGDNWAAMDSFKLTIMNGEDCTIVNPTQIKMKLNNKGKGSVWWDDEVFLPDSFKRMKPGETVSEIVNVHVSYSDVHSEKDFRVYLFDDYDIQMNVFKDYIVLP